MLWLTADLHLGHANILGHASRPFPDVDTMATRLIAAINNRVSYTDELWILGDFTFRTKLSRICELRNRIVCQHVHLVRGNHDRHFACGEADGIFEHDTGYFDELRSPAGRRVVLCHYPIADWNGQDRGSYMLHGHIHSKGTDYNLYQREQGLLRYDVGVDANGYAPVSIEEIDQWFEGIQPKRIHHAE